MTARGTLPASERLYRGHRPTQPQRPGPPYEPPLAPLGPRIGAYAIDYLGTGVVWNLAVTAVSALPWVAIQVLAVAAPGLLPAEGEEPPLTAPQVAVLVVVVLLSTALTLGSGAAVFLAWFVVVPVLDRGRTLGKRLVGIRVVHSDLSEAGGGAHLRRAVLLLVESAGFGVLPGLVLVMSSPTRRRLGDHWAGTVVVRG